MDPQEGVTNVTSTTLPRNIQGTTLAECEAQLAEDEVIVWTSGSRVTGDVRAVATHKNHPRCKPNRCHNPAQAHTCPMIEGV
jgi:hypothetical protein